MYLLDPFVLQEIRCCSLLFSPLYSHTSNIVYRLTHEVGRISVAERIMWVWQKFRCVEVFLPHDNIFDAPEKDSCEKHGKKRQCIFFTDSIFIPFMTEILINLIYCNLVTD